ncbi:putative transcription fungi [Rosellinia necatrix]|uniref:Putative transcription fungi n=1 Tax=Rosellinia necatrix TaxID=77044 RepID=A0A1S8A724_ROSNE|nr:putative transcription fungi [Rosellinia necatrix]
MGDPEQAEAVSGAEDRPNSEPEATKPPPRKRRRIVISCTECHRRKQKVGTPCRSHECARRSRTPTKPMLSSRFFAVRPKTALYELPVTEQGIVLSI